MSLQQQLPNATACSSSSTSPTASSYVSSTPGMTRQKKQERQLRTRQIANRARHRLWSIHRDGLALQTLYRPAFLAYYNQHKKNDGSASSILHEWPWVVNERCGSWYCDKRISNNHAAAPANMNSTSTTTPSTLSIPAASEATTCCHSCYFKSTDGHVGTWNVSLKRLNLHLLPLLTAQDSNRRRDDMRGCFIIDSSMRKELPDSFSRTIPIWACVMNRTVFLYRQQQQRDKEQNVQHQHSVSPSWDTRLYTPTAIVGQEEHDHIEGELMDDHVRTLVQSGAIVDVPGFVASFGEKPLRPLWITNHGRAIWNGSRSSANEHIDWHAYTWLICCNPSEYDHPEQIQRSITNNKAKSKVRWIDETSPSSATSVTTQTKTTGTPHSTTSCSNSTTGYYYTPGAADDQESWARHLTANTFWTHYDELIPVFSSEGTSTTATTVADDDGSDAMIDKIVEKQQQDQHETKHAEAGAVNTCGNGGHSDQIGGLSLWIGSRRGGRPPECWNHYDAILNVTTQEYEDVEAGNNAQQRFYLQLPVEEGKRDKSQLERWMPLGISFILHHIQTADRRVLVHCAQGKDRSAAMAMAFVTIACSPLFPLRLAPHFGKWESLSQMETPPPLTTDHNQDLNDNDKMDGLVSRSGLPRSLVYIMAKKEGRESLLRWVHDQQNKKRDGDSSSDSTTYATTTLSPLASKESLRVILHLVRQYRDVEPSRGTMQKLNRFFMSSSLYRNDDTGMDEARMIAKKKTFPGTC